MLGIQKIEHLARHLATTPERLVEVAQTAASFCEELELTDPAQPAKPPRRVLNVVGDLRRFQTRLLRNLFSRKHRPSIFSHGGVPGRHIKSHAEMHLDSVYAFPTDVANFYPSVSNDRVFRLFLKEFGCHPEVANVCTKLCTHRHHLALGLITSPILADRIMMPIDRRLAAMCHKQGLVYSRYVDDLIISGRFPITSGSYPRLLCKVLSSCGLRVNPKKHMDGFEGSGRLDDGKYITKLEISRRRIRVRKAYLEEVGKQLSDAARLAEGNPMEGCYYTANQIHGRIHFIWWINAGQAAALEGRYRATNWAKVAAEAAARGLVAPTKELRKITAKPLHI
jgi:RNA-directed DNA polymerase